MGTLNDLYRRQLQQRLYIRQATQRIEAKQREILGLVGKTYDNREQTLAAQARIDNLTAHQGNTRNDINGSLQRSKELELMIDEARREQARDRERLAQAYAQLAGDGPLALQMQAVDEERAAAQGDQSLLAILDEEMGRLDAERAGHEKTIEQLQARLESYIGSPLGAPSTTKRKKA